MKTLIIIVAVVSIVFARSLKRHAETDDCEEDFEKDFEAYVLSFNNELSYFDHYNYGFETSNGIKVNQQGEIKDRGGENQHLETKGDYSFVAPNGVLYKVIYTAGENGFRPVVESKRVKAMTEKS